MHEYKSRTKNKERQIFLQKPRYLLLGRIIQCFKISIPFSKYLQNLQKKGQQFNLLSFL
ncbi:hypothetical protein FEM08_30740 [Flavobacterium gilvum]|nr:hypothetical protein FEM08_30740 [Flavobacterium gilvum]